MKLSKKTFISLSIFLFGQLYCLTGFSEVKGNSIIIQSDGKFVVAGYAVVNNIKQGFLSRYNTDGTMDSAFNGGLPVTEIIGENTVYNAVIQQSDGKLVVAGIADFSTQPQFIVVRYNSDGTLDTNFGNAGVVTGVQGMFSAANALVQQSDGKLVITGYSTSNTGVTRLLTIRLTTTGTYDTTFSGDGIVITQSGNSIIGYAVRLQSDGKVLVIGSTQSGMIVARYNTNGTIDTAYGGAFTGIATVTFTGTGFVQAYAGVLQSDGKLIIGGFADSDFALARLTTGGALDTAYDSDGRVTTSFGATSAAINGLVIQSDGKVVAAGYADSMVALARYTTGGALDTTYDSDGKVTTQIGEMARILSAAIQSDDKVVVTGFSVPNPFISRYNTNGTVDGTIGVLIKPAVCDTPFCAYGQVYNESEIDILPEDSFTFDSNGILVNITHSTSENTEDIIITETGDYLITYYLQANSPAVIQITQNGNIIPAASTTTQGSGVVFGRAIISAVAGDVLNLVNATSYDIFLAGGSGVNLSLDLEKIA